MNFKEYQEQSKRTCAPLKTRELNLSHMVMGMNSELPEILDASSDRINLMEEVVDVLWYVSNYMTFRNVNMAQYEHMMKELPYRLRTFTDGYLSLVHSIGELTDIVKKNVAYGKQLDAVKEHTLYQNIIKQCGFILSLFGMDYEEGLQKNIDKLRARFPEQFTQENALNRNLEEERRILEA